MPLVTVTRTDSVEEAGQLLRTPCHSPRACEGEWGAAIGHGVARGSGGGAESGRGIGRDERRPPCLSGGRLAPPPRRQCLRHIQGRSLWKPCGKRRRRKNNKSREERVHSEARLGSLAVLQRRIRELLPTLHPAARWGTRRPCGTPLQSMQEKAQLCARRGPRPAGRGVHRA